MSKEIKKIYNDIINSCDVSKINKENLDIIVNSSYNPIYIATVWKLYKYLYEKSKYGKKLFWIPSGNSIGYHKYQGSHIPWDDDIDIGFELDNANHKEYIDFLIESMKRGFIVNLHFKRVEDDKLDWYENEMSVNLIFDQDRKPSWNHIRESEFRKLMIDNPSKFYFGNVTLREDCFLKIAKKLGLEEFYKWDNKYLTTPWVDIITYTKQKDRFVCQLKDKKNKTPTLSTEFKYGDFLTVPGRFPVDLVQGILHQYNEDRSFENFIGWDTIYSHIKNTKKIFHYANELELQKFVRAYIKKYNEHLLYYMSKISFTDLYV